MNRFAQLALWIMSATVVVTMTACAGRVESDSRSADEAAIREADAASLRAIAAKQVDATVSYYDEGASILMPNAPVVTGREEIRKAWEQMFATPGFNLAPKTTMATHRYARFDVLPSGQRNRRSGVLDIILPDSLGGDVAEAIERSSLFRPTPPLRGQMCARISSSPNP